MVGPYVNKHLNMKEADQISIFHSFRLDKGSKDRLRSNEQRYSFLMFQKRFLFQKGIVVCTAWCCVHCVEQIFGLSHECFRGIGVSLFKTVGDSVRHWAEVKRYTGDQFIRGGGWFSVGAILAKMLWKGRVKGSFQRNQMGHTVTKDTSLFTHWNFHIANMIQKSQH